MMPVGYMHPYSDHKGGIRYVLRGDDGALVELDGAPVDPAKYPLLADVLMTPVPKPRFRWRHPMQSWRAIQRWTRNRGTAYGIDENGHPRTPDMRIRAEVPS